MKIKLSLFIVLVSATALPQWAQTKRPSQLEIELLCADKPHPLKVTKQLQRSGQIALKSYEVNDDMNLFRVKKPFTVWGLKVYRVFAWDYAPKVFTKGPGTAAPYTIGVLIAKRPEEVKSYLKNLGVKGLKIEKSDMDSDYQKSHPSVAITSISCEEKSGQN